MCTSIGKNDVLAIIKEPMPALVRGLHMVVQSVDEMLQIEIEHPVFSFIHQTITLCRYYPVQLLSQTRIQEIRPYQYRFRINDSMMKKNGNMIFDHTPIIKYK